MSINQEVRSIYQLKWSKIWLEKPRENKLKLDPNFRAAIDSLPEHYDEVLYSLLLRYWGVGFVSMAKVGGAAEQIVKMKNCVWNMGIDLQPQFNIDLLSNIYPGTYSIKSLNTFYRDRRVASILTVIGGNPKFSNFSQWDERVKSLEELPALVEIKFESYLPFLVKLGISARKIENIAMAINMSLENVIRNRVEQLKIANSKEEGMFLAPQKVQGFGSGNSWFDPYGWRIPDFWLGSTTSWNISINTVTKTNNNFPYSRESSEWWQPIGLCERNSQGLLRAKSVSTSHPDIGSLYHPISSQDGFYVTSGCSTATQVWDCNNPQICPIFDHPATLRVDCCMFCEPEIVQVCNYRVCGVKLQSCNCSKF